MKLHHPAASPNSRRVRIFLAEKGLSIPLVTVDLGKGATTWLASASPSPISLRW
jgi:glutathione S-transferase